MKLNNQTNGDKTDFDEIDEKIDRLQKQNEAESIALKKLLEGLEKIGKSNPKIDEPKKSNRKKKK